MKLGPKDKALKPVADTLTALSEAVTAIASSDRKDLFLSIGYFFQRLRGQSFLEAFDAEWRRLREKGSIRDDYSRTEQCAACLQELLDCLDHDSPDKIRFDFIKKVFLAAAQEKKSDRDSVLPQQYMRLARQLSSGEILVLTAAYTLSKSSQPLAGRRIESEDIAKESGLVHPELVKMYGKGLTDKFLLSRPEQETPMDIVMGRFDFTPLAEGLCDFLLDTDPSNRD